MAAREQMGANVDQGVIARIMTGLRYAISGVGPENFFGPMQPLPPMAQDRSEGRRFDYPVGFNLRQRPRQDEATTFEQLRGLADAYDLMRLAIETRKDQLESFQWEIVPKNRNVPAETFAEEIKRATEFFERPDKEHDWPQWLRQILEELLVIDAVCIYPRESRGGTLYGLELVDASTVKRVLDDTGRTPLPPDPAYQQVLKGLPASDYTRDQMIYIMRNPRVWKVYGHSPVEQVLMTVNIAIRRQVSQLQHYTEGNIPEAIAQVPDGWTMQQIAEFQAWWDSLNEGNSAQKRKMRFIPKLDNIVFPKGDILKDEYDEWLARLICFAFSLSPSALMKQVNRATSESMADTAREEGVMPLLRFLESQFSMVLQKFVNFPGLKFAWKIVNEVDPSAQSAINKIYLDAKVFTPDEVRENLGKPPLSKEARASAFPEPVGPPQLDEDGKSIPPVGPDGKPFPPKLGPDGKPLPVPVPAQAPPKPNPFAKSDEMVKMLVDRLTERRDAAPQPITVNVAPAAITLGDTFVNVPPPKPTVVKVIGDTNINAPPGAIRKRIRARRDPDTGDLFGEIEEMVTSDDTARLVKVVAGVNADE